MEDSISDASWSSGSVEHVATSVIVAVVLILFMVLLFVFLVSLYARCYWRRRGNAAAQTHPAHDQSTRPRRFVFNITQTQEPVRKGLEPSLLRDLPVLIFHPDKFKEGVECAVCLSELNDGEKARLLPACNHGFHVDCIDMWFQSHSTCPVCRTAVGVSNPQFWSSHESGNSVEASNSQANVSSIGNAGSDQLHESSSSSSLKNVRNASPGCSLVIEIPRTLPRDGFDSMSPSTPTNRSSEDGKKSPLVTRLRSFRRLLSREKRVLPSSPGSVDVEQG